jgi:hypothetical protein
MYTCFITPNRCPCLMRPLPCMAICRNATTRRAASNHVSFSPRQCGARWAAHGRQAAAMRRAPLSQSRRRTMLPSSINSSGSPTTLPSLLLRTCHAAARGTSWVVKVPGTTSTPASIMLLIGPARTTMSCGRWSAFVTTLRLAQQTDLLVDVTLRHNFIGAGQIGQNQGQLRNPDHPDRIPESAAADKIRNYRDTIILRSLVIAAQTRVLSPSRRFRGAIGIASAQSGLRLWLCAAPPPPRVATSLLLATRRPSTWPTTSMTGMSATSTASPR